MVHHLLTFRHRHDYKQPEQCLMQLQVFCCDLQAAGACGKECMPSELGGRCGQEHEAPHSITPTGTPCEAICVVGVCAPRSVCVCCCQKTSTNFFRRHPPASTAPSQQRTPSFFSVLPRAPPQPQHRRHLPPPPPVVHPKHRPPRRVH